MLTALSERGRLGHTDLVCTAFGYLSTNFSAVFLNAQILHAAALWFLLDLTGQVQSQCCNCFLTAKEAESPGQSFPWHCFQVLRASPLCVYRVPRQVSNGILFQFCLLLNVLCCCIVLGSVCKLQKVHLLKVCFLIFSSRAKLVVGEQ